MKRDELLRQARSLISALGESKALRRRVVAALRKDPEAYITKQVILDPEHRKMVRLLLGHNTLSTI